MQRVKYDSVIERFLSAVRVGPNGCWLWTRKLKDSGYGQFSINGITRNAHRAAYELFRGTIEKGLQVDHLCRVRACVNPSHLEAVSARENTRRSLRSPLLGKYKLQLIQCPNGHSYSGDNVAYRSSGHRYCKTCHREDSRRYYEKKRA